ncbi:MAG: hypothetical protein ABFE01_20255, partial [Phycisphaerales bacterium]
QAARDILAIDSSSSTIERIMSMMKSVGNGGFVVEISSEQESLSASTRLFVVCPQGHIRASLKCGVSSGK